MAWLRPVRANIHMRLSDVAFRLWHWRYSRRLGTLGRASWLEKPDMLTGEAGLHIGSEVRIRPGARIECIRFWGYQGEIHIGDRSVAQFYFHCAAADRVEIGCDVLIAGRVYISDHDHEWPAGGHRLVVAPVSIGDRCWLGEGAVVLKGVRLGEGCVVGANAVVTRSAPAGSLLVGAPARVIKRYDAGSNRWVAVDAVKAHGCDEAGARTA